MIHTTAEEELAQFLMNLENATWNQPRSTNELQSFIDSRLEQMSDTGEISLSIFA